jgi:hypothetical protein
LVFVLILGPLRGILRLYIFGWVLKLTASKLDRSASSVEIRAAIAWSNVPLLLALVLWIPQLALFRSEMFTMETPNMDANPWLWNLRFALVLIEGFLFLWSLILFLKCLGEVQGVSAWKALGNVVVAYVVLAVPLLLFLVYVLEPFLDLIL